METSETTLSLEQFNQLKSEGCPIVDTRMPVEVKKGYIAGSLSVPVESSTSYTTWVKSIVPVDTKIILICDLGREKDIVSKLTGLGYSNIQGYLEGGLPTWVNAGNAIEQYECIPAQEFATKLQTKPYVIDVREKSAWDKGVLEGANLIGMNDLVSKVADIPKDHPVYVHCTLGGKSLAAYTTLRAHGLQNVVDIAGGINTVVAHGAELKPPTY